MTGAKIKAVIMCVICSFIMSMAASALGTSANLAPLTNDKTVYLIGLVVICVIAVILLIIKGAKKK